MTHQHRWQRCIAFGRAKITSLAWITIPDIGNDLGLPEADPENVLLNLLRLALQYVPLVAVAMLVIGGLRWMTSAGDEEKVTQAKRSISSAVIGMVIIILAWAIVRFFAQTTLNVTTNS